MGRESILTLMLLVADMVNKEQEQSETLAQLGSDLRVLSESYPMNTNMTGLR